MRSMMVLVCTGLLVFACGKGGKGQIGKANAFLMEMYKAPLEKAGIEVNSVKFNDQSTDSGKWDTKAVPLTDADRLNGIVSVVEGRVILTFRGNEEPEGKWEEMNICYGRLKSGKDGNELVDLMTTGKMSAQELIYDLVHRVKCSSAKYWREVRCMKYFSLAIRDYFNRKGKMKPGLSWSELKRTVSGFNISEINETDAWGNPYLLEYDDGYYNIASAGSDGKFSGFREKGIYELGQENGRDIIFTREGKTLGPKSSFDELQRPYL